LLRIHAIVCPRLAARNKEPGNRANDRVYPNPQAIHIQPRQSIPKLGKPEPADPHPACIQKA